MLVLFISTCVVVSVCSMYMYQLHVHVYDVRVVRVSRVIITCKIMYNTCISVYVSINIAHFSQP